MRYQTRVKAHFNKQSPLIFIFSIETTFTTIDDYYIANGLCILSTTYKHTQKKGKKHRFIERKGGIWLEKVMKKKSHFSYKILVMPIKWPLQEIIGNEEKKSRSSTQCGLKKKYGKQLNRSVFYFVSPSERRRPTTNETAQKLK